MLSPELARAVATLAATELGRGSERLSQPVLDDLGAACGALTAPAAQRVGIITGFYVPRAEQPAAETDGPLGTAVLAQVLRALGIEVEVVTDSACHPVVVAALTAAGVPEALAPAWPDIDPSGWTHAVAIERVGHGADGRHRNMLGHDISDVTPPLDVMFEELTVPKMAIGDGGNEAGMGRLDPALIDATVHLGATIRSVVGCDHLIVGGTSNWGAHALAVLLAAPAEIEPPALTEDGARAILDAMVAAGSVDGVTAKNVATVDGLSWEDYWAIPERINRLLDEAR
ncbi:MAG: DUF4392 domain-containing protein [Actinomycetia bacterium]|nr:DUF4392 domain-containing protein [Actinomycetes bacterium]